MLTPTQLAKARYKLEQRMTDTISVTRPGEKVWDEDSGEYVSTPVAVYSGSARVRHDSGRPGDIEAGGQLLTLGSLEVHVPIGSATFQPDDQIAVTACPTRPDQVGRVFVVIAPFDGSQTTAVRYRVQAFDAR